MAPKRVRACNLLDEFKTASVSFRLKDQILVKLERDIHNAWMRRADLLTQCSNILADSGKRQDYIAEMELLPHSEISDLSIAFERLMIRDELQRCRVIMEQVDTTRVSIDRMETFKSMLQRM